MFYWLLKYVVLGPVLKLLFRPRVEGLANVPATGPVIAASASSTGRSEGVVGRLP